MVHVKLLRECRGVDELYIRNKPQLARHLAIGTALLAEGYTCRLQPLADVVLTIPKLLDEIGDRVVLVGVKLNQHRLLIDEAKGLRDLLP